MSRRNRENEFEVTWEAEDGYVGGARPQHFSIDASDIDTEMDDRDLSALFWEEIQNDFDQKIHAISNQEVEFIVWAKEQQERMRAEEDAL